MIMNLTNKPTTFMWFLRLSKRQIHTFCCLHLKSGVILTPILHSQHIFNWPTKGHQNTGIIQPLPTTSKDVNWSSTIITIRSDMLPLQWSWLPAPVPLYRMLFFLHALSVHILVLGLNVALSERSFTSTLYSYPLIPQKPLPLLYLLYDTHHYDSFIHYFHHSTTECFIHCCVSGT